MLGADRFTLLIRLRDLFVAAVPSRIGSADAGDSAKEELKFSFAELRDMNFSLRDSIGEALIKKANVSFQDMKSTVRAFTGYLGLDTLSGGPMNNIIVAQAARHVIVTMVP